MQNKGHSYSILGLNIDMATVDAPSQKF